MRAQVEVQPQVNYPLTQTGLLIEDAEEGKQACRLAAGVESRDRATMIGFGS
jgi:hypothetical protein